MPGQSESSVAKNKEYFDRNVSYSEHIEAIDTYARIRTAVTGQLSGVGHLLDIGNGGVFDYDISVPRRITAVDLFFGNIDVTSYPGHIEFKEGSALDLPFGAESFDAVLIVMLVHHLTGTDVRSTIQNVLRCIDESARVLRPNGKLIIMESCVPQWFYAFECAVFGVATALLNKLIKHPVTLQHTARSLGEMLNTRFAAVEVKHVPKGRYILQFGIKVPSILTPVEPYLFVATKNSTVSKDF